MNCGFPGVSEGACLAKGCCWDKSVRGVPWCFRGVQPATTERPTEPPGPNCNVGKPRNRVNCGIPGISRRKCLAKGCCWDKSVRGVPWCFRGVNTTLPPTHEPDPSCAAIPPSKRKDCGYPGIPPDVCHRRHCCWDESIRDVPWCFFGKSMTTTHEPEPRCDAVPPSQRENCGYAGIWPDACRRRKCCWDESIRDVPWCFFGVGTTTATPVTQPPIAHCDVLYKSRKPCGQPDVTREECIKEGCCWQLSMLYGVPSCYLGASRPGPDGCDPQLPNRLTCGPAGIDEKQCSGKGCCWDDAVPGRPKCYRPNTGKHSSNFMETSR